MIEVFWAAFALVLILEGLLPFITPRGWRRMFGEMLKMRDGQIRFFGLISLVSGTLLWLWVT